MVKNFRITLHHHQGSQRTSQHEEEENKNNNRAGNNSAISSQDRIQLLEHADKILQEVGVANNHGNNDGNSNDDDDQKQIQKIQKMRAVLKGMMNAMQTTSFSSEVKPNNVDGNANDNIQTDDAASTRLAWNKKLASVALLFESAELK